MISFTEPERQKIRGELIAARGAEYRAGFMTEAQFRAYLFSIGERGEDISHRLREYAPAPRRSWEDARMDESRKWLEEYPHVR